LIINLVYYMFPNYFYSDVEVKKRQSEKARINTWLPNWTYY